VKRIGGNETIKINVRFIAATNKNLEQLITEKCFREDLYYRLSTAILNLPPLRERREEIIHLANHFLSSIPNPAFQSMSLSAETIEFLQAYDWPGNIRELKSTIQYSAAIAGSPVINPTDLPRKLAGEIKMSSKGNLRQEMEADLIMRILRECSNKKQAAEMLGISRATLYNKIKEFGLK
jgi:DNA-binding NtrC family response regulator